MVWSGYLDTTNDLIVDDPPSPSTPQTPRDDALACDDSATPYEFVHRRIMSALYDHGMDGFILNLPAWQVNAGALEKFVRTGRTPGFRKSPHFHRWRTAYRPYLDDVIDRIGETTPHRSRREWVKYMYALSDGHITKHI